MAPADEALAASILDGVNHEFKVTWDEPLPGLGLGTMLITIFTFIAIALVFTTIAGSELWRSSSFREIALSEQGLRSPGNDGNHTTQARSRSYRQADRSNSERQRKL